MCRASPLHVCSKQYTFSTHDFAPLERFRKSEICSCLTNIGQHFHVFDQFRSDLDQLGPTLTELCAFRPNWPELDQHVPNSSHVVFSEFGQAWPDSDQGLPSIDETEAVSSLHTEITD